LIANSTGAHAQVVEHADTCAQQDGHQVDADLVEKLGLQALLQAASDADLDVLLPRGFLRLTDGALDPIGDEGERRFYFDPFPGDAVGQNETRRNEGRTAPGSRNIEVPPMSPSRRSTCSLPRGVRNSPARL